MIKGSVASLVLIIVIVLQSFSAIADASETHQLDVNHLQTEHSHSDDVNVSTDISSTTEHDIEDCHHCGHCSGSHLAWILVKDVSNLINLMSFEKTPYPFTTQKEFIEATLRPPIA